VTIFPYRGEPSAAVGIILRPVASVLLSTSAATLEVAMYIDSGADMTLIPFRLGRALGFRQRPSDRIVELSGIGGAGVPYAVRRARMRIGDISLKIRLAWALIEEVPPLLGRLDIFPRFRIIFDERRLRVTFTPARS
jgi:hypothetical protein